jgi:hypothetical protein
MSCAILLASMTLTRGAVGPIYRDTFTVGDGTGVAGTNLNTPLEVGGQTWTSTGMLFNADNTIHFGAPTIFTTAYVPKPAGNSAMLVQGDMHPVGATATNEWIAVGFFNSSQTTVNDLTNHELWALVSQAGNYTFFAKSVTYTLATGAVPNYSSSGLNTVEVGYDPAINTATLTINGTLLATSNLTTLVPSFTPNISEVGFTQIRQTSSAQFDNFAVWVPEPASLALFSVALGAVSIRCRKRA